ncbi:MAG: CapA family protein [Steroidobacteraceae bacterium]|nr:CapA family protein [Deltaproteobacteria bacterium]
MKPALALILLTLMFLCTPISLLAEEIVINAAGDIMLAGKWAPVLKSSGYGYPFDGIKAELAKGDINIANLESPIASGGSEFSGKQFRFRAEPAVAKAIRAAGFNMVTLANNHSMDYGGAALAETLGHLDAAGIAWIGAGLNLDEARQMALYTVKGKKIAFLGYSLTRPIEFFAGKTRPGTAPGYEKLVTADVASARRQADYVIVSFHWGKEAGDTAQANQRNAAHNAIDAGADVIIGHHPHVLQGVEIYKKGIIFYSLGNLAFASKSTTADVGALIRLRLDEKQRTAEILPLDVLNHRVGFQPRLLSGTRAEAVMEKLRVLSQPFRTEIRNSGGKYSVDFSGSDR